MLYANQYHDADGRVRTVDFRIGDAKRIEESLGVDLLSLLNPKAQGQASLYEQLFSDEVLLLDVLSCIAQDVHDLAATNTPEAAGALLAGIRVFFRGYTAAADHAEAPAEVKAVNWWREVYHWAGIVGVDPRPLRFGELRAMVEGANRDVWASTSALLAMAYNVGLRPKQWQSAKLFDPYHARQVRRGFDFALAEQFFPRA
jgi:hypothetical protein